TDCQACLRTSVSYVSGLYTCAEDLLRLLQILGTSPSITKEELADLVNSQTGRSFVALFADRSKAPPVSQKASVAPQYRGT
ncbi:hypothetical protein, partial [Rhizobium leguminosarum]|uniref:hypothetical protein n=1 Tax=Rhizobium leguminosarum TaxID=384 RepID=UPI003F9963E6